MRRQNCTFFLRTKSLRIPKGQSEVVNQMRENKMV